MTRNQRSSFTTLLIALVGIVVVICLFTGLGAIGLVGPDEPRYAWIARNMQATGDWITPKLYGQPWFEKPVLYYWAAAVGFKFLHSSEWAARLPSALAALIALLSMAALACRRYGRETACAVFLIFPTSLAIIAFARAAGPDMLFTASLSLTLFFAFRILEKHAAFVESENRLPSSSLTTHDKLDLAFLGISLGFATLAKGPAALVLAGGSVLLWAATTRNLRLAFRMLHPLAILCFAAVALPWYIICAHANPGFFHVFIVEHNFERYLTPVFQHRQPFWFFGPIILLGLLPWSALLISAALDARRIFRNGSWRVSSGFFIACWVIFPTLFFSFSRSKLPEYILPVFAPLCLLLARSIVCAIDWAPRKAQWMGVAMGTMCVVLGAMAAIGLHRLPAYAPIHPPQTSNLAIACLLLGVASGIVVELMSLWRKLWLVLAFTAAISAFAVLAANTFILPQLDPLLSARPLAHEIRAAIAPPVGLFSFGDINRNCDYGLRFYLDRTSLPEFNPDISHDADVLLSTGGDMKLNDLGETHRVMLARFLPYCWVESVKPRESN